LNTITFSVGAPVTPQDICNLREAVGWDRHDEDYPAAFQRYWATVSGFDPSGSLRAWCAILSDGVRHAVLLDVIVHPDYQRQGSGTEIVARAIQHSQIHGISISHVDFRAEHAPF